LSCKARASVAACLAFGLLALAGCEVSLPQPNAADAARLHGSGAELGLQDLELGRALYSSRCGSCHALRDPASERPEAWGAEVHEMRAKKGVRLTDDEEQRITAYLVSISSR